MEESTTTPQETAVFVRPSSLAQCASCPGSFFMESGIPEESSEAAEEGTRLHAALANAVVKGALDTDGFDIEQSVCLQACWDVLQKELDDFPANSDGINCDAEVPLEIRDKDGQFLTRGTADIVIADNTGRVVIIDWKFGRGEVIEARRNLQLAAYAAGAMQLFHASSCRSVVVQPRLGRVTDFTYTNLNGILDTISGIVKAATEDGEMVLNPSESTCRYCRAKSCCPAFMRSFRSVERVSQLPVLKSLQPEKLAALYTAGQSVKKWIDGELSQAMTKYLDEHGELDGYKWQEVQGRKEVADIQGLADAFGEVLTPAQFRSACKVSLSSLLEVSMPSLQAKCKSEGGKGTKSEAKVFFEKLSESFVVRGKPSRRIVRVTSTEGK